MTGFLTCQSRRTAGGAKAFTNREAGRRSVGSCGLGKGREEVRDSGFLVWEFERALGSYGLDHVYPVRWEEPARLLSFRCIFLESHRFQFFKGYFLFIMIEKKG